MNRKGALTDLFIILIVGFVFLLMMIMLTLVIGMITSNIEAIPSTPNENVNVSEVASATFGKVNTGMGVWYWAMGAIILGMFLAILISNFLIKAHPAFFILYVFIIVVAVIVGAGISNAYESAVLGSPLLAEEAGKFLGVNAIMLNLPIWVTVIGFLGCIILFMGMPRDQGLGGSVV